MVEIKGVKVMKKVFGEEVFVTSGTIKNVKEDGIARVRIMEQISFLDEVDVAVKTGINTVKKNPGTALGATAYAVLKSAYRMTTGHYNHSKNVFAKELSDEYYKDLNKNTKKSRVLWERKFSEIMRMRLESSGTVLVYLKSGITFIFKFKNYSKANEWFEEAKKISGMQSVKE